MLRFLRYVLATFVALVLFAVLSVVVLVAIASSANPPEQIKEGSVFHLKIDKPLAEREYKSMWSGVRGAITGSDESRIGLLELRMAIREAASNENIKGIYLDAGSVKSGTAMLDELRNELIEFKKSGKFIISYSESYTEGGYYLASVADEIVLMPAGMLEFNGLRAEIMFFKGTLEKLELQPEIFRVGNYKSAVEPFFREDMSKENREQINGYLSAINNHIIQGVAQARKLDSAQVHLISDSMLVHNGNDALKYKLITKLGYYDEAEDLIRTRLKIEKDAEIHFTGYKTLHTHSLTKIEESVKADTKEIAVIFATGEIVDGKGSREVIGSISMSEQIRKAREDDNIKAVVIRINSPGGSAAGSDAIWREILLTSRVKPVIASMSDVCASGGYYMAMACDTIVASPVTITGSIGVWGLMFNGQNFLKNKLGITVDRERTGKFSDVPSFTRPLTEYEKQMIQQEVNNIYADFITKAAQGRNTDTASIDKVAGGRVWAGAQAKGINLIDTYGGLQTAIDIAAKRAGMKEYSVTYLPKAKVSLLKEILSGVDDDEEAAADVPADAKLMTDLGPWYEYFKTIQELQKLNGVQARMPYGMTIE